VDPTEKPPRGAESDQAAHWSEHASKRRRCIEGLLDRAHMNLGDHRLG
jgi:hypothetical protein